MFVSITRNNKNTWDVVALEGPFEGQVIAVCEGLGITDVRFTGNRIIGKPTAIWGAVINDDITSDRQTLFGLGIGRPFDARRKQPILFNGESYVDKFTNERMVNAKYVMVFKSGVFYRN